jgi:membrane-bound lytic murein transglycosylase D
MNVPRESSPRLPKLRVRTPDGRSFRFSQSFHIGRGEDCEVTVEDGHVSRRHVQVSFSDGHWHIRDLHSSNGVFVNDERVETATIDGPVALRLGAEGPVLTLEAESSMTAAKRPIAATLPPSPPSPRHPGDAKLPVDYAERYFGDTAPEEELGPRTMMIRKAFKEVQKKERRRYGVIVAAAAIVAVVMGGYAFYGHQQMRRQQAIAEELFYSMKSLDVDIANVERLVASSGNVQSKEQVRQYLERRRQMEANYDSFLSGLNLYDRKLTEQEQLILRVTRRLGECELAAPPEYLTEVGTYIRKWQGSGRFARAVKLAQDMGYTRTIVREFQEQNLPPQFFYLAMQESDFDAFTSGPPTYMGIAKGMWQFIPETAKRYGLSIGPLVELRRPDPGDDRHKWQKATVAAARYIKEIYSTDAQASGLLVMASYNWGERRVINLLRSMPANPRERNFWKVLEKYRDRVPKETYDYVLYIVSAAVIGENPRLFGFPFDNPLAAADQP